MHHGEEVDAGVVRHVREGVAGGREAHVVDPRVGAHLAEGHAHLLEGHVGPEELRGLVVHRLERGGEEAHGAVRGPGREHRVGLVPRGGQDRGLEAIDHLADPPVLLCFVVADRHGLVPSAHGELLLRMAPLAVSRRAVQPQVHQRGLPDTTHLLPHVRVAVLRAAHQHVGLRRPVQGGDALVVFAQHCDRGERRAVPRHDVHLIVAG
mmetsp:Transcript_35147/g.83274  ORF Transcript_35147/g.83274 Transcript_35147/m.83274 type:complete len:208 (-) Transcript_35147:178-801(-)